jgi:hypothetical protein
MALIELPAVSKVKVGDTFDIQPAEIRNVNVVYAPSAKPYFRFSLLAGVNISAPNYADSSPLVTSTSTTSGYGFDIGATAEIIFWKKIGLEAGVFTFRRAFTLAADIAGSNSAIYNSYYIFHFPVLFRYHLDQHFSFGLGGYYNINPGFLTYDNFKAYDSGAVASVRYEHKLNENFLVALDARYQYGLINMATSATATVNMRDYQILAGVVFKFGDKSQ